MLLRGVMWGTGDSAISFITCSVWYVKLLQRWWRQSWDELPLYWLPPMLPQSCCQHCYGEGGTQGGRSGSTALFQLPPKTVFFPSPSYHSQSLFEVCLTSIPTLNIFLVLEFCYSRLLIGIFEQSDVSGFPKLWAVQSSPRSLWCLILNFICQLG